MSTDALDPSVSPSGLNQPSARRLSKLPAILIMGVALLVVCLLGYSILTRGQPREASVDNDDEIEEVGTTLFSANDIIQGQDKSVFERPILPEKEKPESSKTEVPKLAKPTVTTVEKIPVRTIPTVRTPTAPEVKSPEELAADDFANKVARAKEKLFLDAIGARTLAASAPDVEEEAVNARQPDGNNPAFVPGGVRDRTKEQREIRERLASQQQTSPDLERIASLLSTIAENTSPQAKQTTPSYRGGGLSSTNQIAEQRGLTNQGVATKRLTGLEALASLSGSRAANSGLALNNGVYQGGLASRPVSNNGLSPAIQGAGIGRLSQAQKDLLALAENSPAGTFVQAKRDYGYSTEAAREQLTDTDLRVGTIIPAILINGINSELAGVAIAQVSQNVWDSTHGEHVLIPQGTKLIGEFKSDIKEGQSRVGVSWNRLQFPDGRTLSLSNMVGSDQAGFTGFSDRVNNHYKKKFGSATLLSIISGVASMFTSYSDKQTSGEAFTNQISQQYATVGSKLIEKNLEIPPTIIIRPGYRFNVIVTQDFALKPYYD